MKGKEAFYERMRSLLGEESEAFFHALTLPPSRSFRFEREKVDKETLFEAFGEGLGEEIPFGEDALRFSFEGIGNHPLHHGGALYVQEPAAMAPVAALGNRRFRRILDLCAAPGGKSLQAARLLTEDGVIVSNEPDPRRRRVLLQNLERMGLRKSQVTGFDAREIPEEWNGLFDLVLCDAPCSGEGMVRKSPEIAEEWSLENVLLCARRQREILRRAARLVAKGGILMYSTCAWSTEENEETVLSFLEENEGFALIPPEESVSRVCHHGIPLAGKVAPWEWMCRFYPHRFDGEGQFLALMEKSVEEPLYERKEKKKKKGKSPSKESEAVLRAGREFLSSVLTEKISETLLIRGEELFLVPDGGVEAEKTVSPGPLLGEVRKGRVIPHHRFFLAYAPLFARKVVLEPSDERVEKYLRGEEIPLEGESGWAVLYCGSCPLGGVRPGGGRGKNCYPKGLRKD